MRFASIGFVKKEMFGALGLCMKHQTEKLENQISENLTDYFRSDDRASRPIVCAEVICLHKIIGLI